jgi:hypothetical protein
MNKIVVVLATMVVLSLTAATGIKHVQAAAEVEIEHEHETSNNNNEHEASNNIDNLGGKEGFHFNSHCNENSNNDKGEVCRDNEKDRRD